MILHVFLLVILGPLALVSCQSDSGGKKVPPSFTFNDLDSISASTNAAVYPISGTCHEEEAVIALTVNDTFSSTLEVTPSTAPSCSSSKSWSTTVDVSSLRDGILTVAALYKENTEKKQCPRIPYPPPLESALPIIYRHQRQVPMERMAHVAKTKGRWRSLFHRVEEAL